ncbi:thermonuclease family protein [Geothermobacter hydrogeniphilus]|uniref:TNase-like domain-containing protein n=1 Tax=Geothermobacter hydrogeniphilus TaxID=1969733 RepID=A0A1X0Y892_9BACT|nr:thermonuclease family protein [Geothermobacter hydrogeniphilus]ORJ61332.1 hypothetical protein B5V00_06785 [Geothermobacter hydrogeniphilus]
MLRILFLLLFISFPGFGYASSFTGKVVKVSDGDTIQVLNSGKAVKIRLAEIDCPETSHGPKKPGQPFGQAAKKFALALVGGKTVRVDVVTRDRYGRTVGKVVLDDGSTLNKRLVEAGLAWVYRRYAKDPVLFELEKTARAASRGLWSDPNPVPPWEWRHGAGWGAKHSKAPGATVSDSRCGQKRYCKEMTSCEEAKFYLNRCGLSSLDRDGDGVPCEKLCR